MLTVTLPSHDDEGLLLPCLSVMVCWHENQRAGGSHLVQGLGNSYFVPQCKHHFFFVGYLGSRLAGMGSQNASSGPLGDVEWTQA